MANLITDRVAYFLKDYPPFSFLEYEELEQLAHQMSVKYIKKDQVIFEEGTENTGFIYVLRQGSVKLSKTNNEKIELIDQCEPGDIFGVRSTLSGKAYVMTALAIDESLVYTIPTSNFHKLLDEHQKCSLFFASGYAAGQAVVRGGQSGAKLSIHVSEESKLEYSRHIISCNQKMSIKEAAGLMTHHNVGSIVVVENDLPIGIITDSDLRRKVVAKGFDIHKPVEAVMTSPLVTIHADTSVSEVQMKMIERSIHHLLITEDGSENARAIGIVSDHDVMISRLNHPSALLKAIKYSYEIDKWAGVRNKAEKMLETLLEQEMSIGLISSLITQINDLIIQKAIIRSIKNLDLQHLRFCWLGLGSEGRGEQLLRTDQDNAIVFEDSEQNESNQEKLLKLAREVNGVLVACGFDECPADIMARNPKWCQPLSVWKNIFSNWISTPDSSAIMHSSIFFDFRPVYGDSLIADQLSAHLFEEAARNGTFLNFLAKNAIQNPAPLSLFNNLVVERSGKHSEEFDIKKRAMMPLADAARVLALYHGISGKYATTDRFKAIGQKEPKYAGLMSEAAQAYEILMRYRAKAGLNQHDSGRFLDVANLNKLEKRILKNAFQPVKELQEILEVRFKLAFFQ